jgi:hypothetical protein
MLCNKVIAVYSENHMESINICGQNVELQIVKRGSLYNYHLALKEGQRLMFRRFSASNLLFILQIPSLNVLLSLGLCLLDFPPYNSWNIYIVLS